MSDLTSQGPLHLEVRDFGPIVKAEIELRPLTVLLGPSNTGKTYLAILIYALHQHFSGRSPTPDFPSIFKVGGVRGVSTSTLSQQDINSIIEWVAQLSTKRKGNASNERTMDLDDPISDIIHREFNLRCVNASGLLLDEIMRCFGAKEINGLIRRHSKTGAHVVLRKHSMSDALLSRHEITIKNEKSKCVTKISRRAPVQIDADRTREFASKVHDIAKTIFGQNEQTRGQYSILASHVEKTLTDSAMPHFVGPLHHDALYFPADRAGVMHLHRLLVSAAIDDISMRRPSPSSSISAIPGVLVDFLRQLIAIGDPEDRRGERRKSGLGMHIEKSMLAGSVNVRASEATGYPHFTYQPNGWTKDLPLMNASSMVSELVPVVLCLDYIVKLGDVLIIEEPESHLHPSMQVEFIRQIVRLIHSGLKVVMTTHSEWVLEELSNVVLRNKLPKIGQKGIARESDDGCALGPEQVGVWLFQEKQRPKGSVVTEISLKDQSGIYPSGFEEVAEALHNNWVDIKNRS